MGNDLRIVLSEPVYRILYFLSNLGYAKVQQMLDCAFSGYEMALPIKKWFNSNGIIQFRISIRF